MHYMGHITYVVAGHTRSARQCLCFSKSSRSGCLAAPRIAEAFLWSSRSRPSEALHLGCLQCSFSAVLAPSR